MPPTEFARRWLLVGLALAGAALAGGLLVFHLLGDRAPAQPMTQQAYVWQRVWNRPFQEGLVQASPQFDGLIVVGAEVAFTGAGQPLIARSQIDFHELGATGKQVSLTIRIGPFSGPTITRDLPQLFADLAWATVVEARQAGIRPAELIVDFDCPRHCLADCSMWIEAIKARVDPLPLCIVVLPEWLDEQALADLLSFADGFVLSARFLKPAGPDDPMVLFDPAQARRRVEQAGTLGRPFRVSLPTYNCLVAFDAAGKCLGISTRGRKLSWPGDAIVRVVPSDPAAIAALVAEWSRNRPRQMTGLIWDRLPSHGDRNTWPIDTLRLVMSGRPPSATGPE